MILRETDSRLHRNFEKNDDKRQVRRGAKVHQEGPRRPVAESHMKVTGEGAGWLGAAMRTKCMDEPEPSSTTTLPPTDDTNGILQQALWKPAGPQ